MRFLLLAAFTSAVALPACADPCHDRIAQMFVDGPLDPYARPPHRHVNRVTDAQGVETMVFTSVLENPVRTISGVEGSGLFAMVTEEDSWTGPGIDGPWSPAPNHLPEDHAAYQRAIQMMMIANLDQTACPGATSRGGMELEEFHFFTKTDPTEASHGAWFGSMNRVFIDMDQGRVMFWEMTDHVNSWSKGVDPSLHSFTYEYDETIRLLPPG